MTITMSEKHQITIPKKIAAVLGLKKGSLFQVQLKQRCIELIPVEVVKKTYTEDEYKKIDQLVAAQKGTEKKINQAMIEKMKKGK